MPAAGEGDNAELVFMGTEFQFGKPRLFWGWTVEPVGRTTSTYSGSLNRPLKVVKMATYAYFIPINGWH